MAMMIQPRATRRKKRKSTMMALAFILFILVSIVIYYYPGYKRIDLNKSDSTILYFNGGAWKDKAIYVKEQLYIPLSFIKERIDQNIKWDQKNNQIIITTEDNIYHLPYGIKEGHANFKPYTISYPVINQAENIYLPVDPIKDLYDLEIIENKEYKIISVYQKNEPYQTGEIISMTKLREKPSKRSPWFFEVTSQEDVRLMNETKGWYWIETKDGKMGFVEESEIVLTGIYANKIEKEIYQPFNPLGEKIFMTWEYATKNTPSFKEIGDLTGVQVISPTWFHLQADGMVINKADKSYVDEAHKKGIQIWALFSNGFDPDLTNAFLNDSNLRMKAIQQILSYIDLYELDGINIDFENIYLKDKEGFLQFVRELAPVLHEKDRTLSVDVTIPSVSENWSMCYDREKLSQIADYIIVMGYDEYPRTSKIAGSTSSIPWLENGLNKVLEEVPQEKLILGIPYYTRLWSETINENGEKIVSNSTMSMKQIEAWIKKEKPTLLIDEQSGQHYVESEEDGIVYKMWLEDELSLEKRINIIKQNRLAGVATWRRGFEKDDTWTFIKSILNKR